MPDPGRGGGSPLVGARRTQPFGGNAFSRETRYNGDDSNPKPAGEGSPAMCRNIKTLFNFDPPTTEEEMRAAALQYVRKLSGFSKPSKANEEAFDRAVEEVAEATRRLLDSLVTNARPRIREVEIQRARIRSIKRFGARET